MVLSALNIDIRKKVVSIYAPVRLINDKSDYWEIEKMFLRLGI